MTTAVRPVPLERNTFLERKDSGCAESSKFSFHTGEFSAMQRQKPFDRK